MSLFWGQPNRSLRETQVISESTTYLVHEWLSDSGKFMIVFECLTIPQIHTPILSGLYMVLCVSLPLVPGPGPILPGSSPGRSRVFEGEMASATYLFIYLSIKDIKNNRMRIAQ